MRNRQVYIVASILTLIGLAIFAYKILVSEFPMMPGETTQAWDVEARFVFEGSDTPVKASTFVPRDRPGVHVQDIRVIAPGYGTSRQDNANNREITLATRKASGTQTLYVKFLIRRFASRETGQQASEPAPNKPKFNELGHTAVDDLIKRARAISADTPSFVTALIKRFAEATQDDSVLQLLGRKKGVAARADAIVTVLGHADIAARRVNGIDLSGLQKDAKLVRWLEIFDQGRWQAFALDTGNTDIPNSYLAWWYGPAPLIAITGAARPKHKLSFVQLQQATLDRILADGRNARSQLVTLSLFSLPLATQDVYRVLTVVPLGIFILVIIRNVIGLRSLGTFMPVLIALAFRETKIVWGIILFTTIVGSGLLFRAYLEHLKLLLVPRLAAVLIFVVLFMAGLSVVTNQLGLSGGISIALFPMVIMTMTIERVSVIWDELGAQTALKQAFGSLAIAALCYLVMSHPMVEHLFFTFPELLLVLLAGTLLLGRYSGYRLLELPRFKVLAGGDR